MREESSRPVWGRALTHSFSKRMASISSADWQPTSIREYNKRTFLYRFVLDAQANTIISFLSLTSTLILAV